MCRRSDSQLAVGEIVRVDDLGELRHRASPFAGGGASSASGGIALGEIWTGVGPGSTCKEDAKDDEENKVGRRSTFEATPQRNATLQQFPDPVRGSRETLDWQNSIMTVRRIRALPAHSVSFAPVSPSPVSILSNANTRAAITGHATVSKPC
jgi:hypothetical protein